MRFRNWIACYGVAATMILEQLGAVPRSTVTETPTPQVRVRERFETNNDWHPDELVTRQSGRQFVIVWDDPSATEPEFPPAHLLYN